MRPVNASFNRPRLQVSVLQTKPMAPLESWWLSLPQEGFTARCEAESWRMRSVKLPKAVARLLDEAVG